MKIERLVEDGDELIVDVKSCARCEDDHNSILFRQFTRPAGEATYFAICPKTQEPILMNQNEADEPITAAEFWDGEKPPWETGQ